MEDALTRARAALLAADACEGVADRFERSLEAAMQSALALLATRAGPCELRLGGDVWRVFLRLVPELAEWAAYFAAAAAKQRAVTHGVYQVGAREADDLFRDAQAFHVEVVRRLRPRAGRGRRIG